MSLRHPEHPAGSPGRRAAFAIHCLAPDDRNWLVANLPAGALAQVEPLLNELATLGVSAEPRFVRDVLASTGATTDATSRTRDCIAKATAHQVWNVLRPEPVVLTGWLLALGPWPWEASLMKKLDGDAHAEVVEARNAPVCGRGAEALLEAVAHRLRQPREPLGQRALRTFALLRWKP